MRKHSWLLIILFACITTLSPFVSCTYDYFVDETNYLVYVPEVKAKSVRDCRIMVYDANGNLVGEKYALSPFSNDERMVRGEFGFRLNPGEYKVYCYTNTDSVSFVDTRSYETSAFHLLQNGSENRFMAPSDIFFQKLEPNIIHPGMLNVDTTDIKRYTGRILVRFKNFPKDVSNINKVDLLAQGIATKQFLEKDTLTTRMSENDVLTQQDGLEMMQITSNSIEVHHRYLPSIGYQTFEEGIEKLNFTFKDSQDNIVQELGLEVFDQEKFVHKRLLHGRTLFIEVDTYVISHISLEGWSEDIDGGDVNMQ